MKSVLLEFAMFPTDHGESKSEYVSQIIKTIRDSGANYQLTPMGTIVEFENIDDALALVKKSYETLEELGCNRVYSTLKFDIRNGKKDRLKSKIEAVTSKIGQVNT
ncbi:MAG: MTH1187 family thiamine-binding protein [Campylobacterales bacterium]|nr:MTH1187 family thiamine-binding protein [Campylobacterales bacterium]